MNSSFMEKSFRRWLLARLFVEKTKHCLCGVIIARDAPLAAAVVCSLLLPLSLSFMSTSLLFLRAALPPPPAAAPAVASALSFLRLIS